MGVFGWGGIVCFLLCWVLIAIHRIFDLSCGMRDISVKACKLLVAACAVYFPDKGSNPSPLHWECRILTTGPPGRSQETGFGVGWLAPVQRLRVGGK